MRVLLVHPDDSPTEGEWSGSPWDLVIDLGWAGTAQYTNWSESFRCPVRGLYSYAEWAEDVRRVQKGFRSGDGRLLDREGIDWWQLLAPMGFQPIYEYLLVLKVAKEIPAAAEVRVTRPHRHADVLSKLLGFDVFPFVRKVHPISALARRYAKTLRTLSVGQVTGIALDKCDADYRFRRFVRRAKRKESVEPAILLPSSYRNMSRILAEYARVLPERNFLLATTRADGAIPNLPRNVKSVPLSAYAPWPRSQASEREVVSLTRKWRALQEELLKANDPLVTFAASRFPDIASTLKVGIRIRDAWREVLHRARITSVLCGDENNPYTRLPVLLAKSRGMKTVHCSHGALDVNLLLRGICSDTYLAKGEMEKDYMTRECGVPEERIALGAPPLDHGFSSRGSTSSGDQIVFFSEPYELYGGRTQTLYREVLPSLCTIARQHGRKVVLKLHPYENVKERSRLADKILTGEDRQLVEVSCAPVAEQLLRRIWFGMTVESSVAVECALAGIPFFLCGWFDLGMHGYGRQYERFGAARVLKTPQEVLRIPEMLDSRPNEVDRRQGFYQAITQPELEGILP